jgi:hypothetical protein
MKNKKSKNLAATFASEPLLIFAGIPRERSAGAKGSWIWFVLVLRAEGVGVGVGEGVGEGVIEDVGEGAEEGLGRVIAGLEIVRFAAREVVWDADGGFLFWPSVKLFI